MTLFDQPNSLIASSAVHLYHGQVLAIVYWLEGNRNRYTEKLCEDPQQARWYIIETTKAILKKQVNQYLTEREIVAEEISSPKVMDAIQMVRQAMYETEKEGLALITQRLQLHYTYLQLILPQEGTMKHDYWKRWLANLMLFCDDTVEQILKTT